MSDIKLAFNNLVSRGVQLADYGSQISSIADETFSQAEFRHYASAQQAIKSRLASRAAEVAHRVSEAEAELAVAVSRRDSLRRPLALALFGAAASAIFAAFLAYASGYFFFVSTDALAQFLQVDRTTSRAVQSRDLISFVLAISSLVFIVVSVAMCRPTLRAHSVRLVEVSRLAKKSWTLT